MNFFSTCNGAIRIEYKRLNPYVAHQGGSGFSADPNLKIIKFLALTLIFHKDINLVDKKQNKNKISMHMDLNFLLLVQRVRPDPLLYTKYGSGILLIRTKNFTDNFDAQHRELAVLNRISVETLRNKKGLHIINC